MGSPSGTERKHANQVLLAKVIATGGVEARSLADWMALVSGGAGIVVTDPAYGAVGDNSTSNTTAIQAALDAVPSTGGSVFIPPGTYRTATLRMKSNTRLYGAGPSSILKFTSVSGGAGTTGPGGIMASADDNTDMSVSDLKLDTTLIAGGNKAVAWYKATKTRVDRLHVITSGQGVVNVNCSDYWVTDSYFESTASLGDALIDQWWGSHDGHITGNTVEGNDVANYAILATGGDTSGTLSTPVYNIEIRGNIVRNIEEAGIYVQGNLGGASLMHVVGNTVDRVVDHYGILIEDIVKNSVFDGNIIKDTAANGIRLRKSAVASGPTGNTISNNIVVNPNTGSSETEEGAAISLGFGSVSTDNLVTGNRVSGSLYVRPLMIHAGCDNNVVGINVFPTGTVGGMTDQGSGNIIWAP